MPHAANLPSIREIRALADEFGIEMSDQEAQSYRMFMQGPISSYRRLEELPEFRPPVKYPRTPGYRAAAEDNPYNAWYWRATSKARHPAISKASRLESKIPSASPGFRS